MPFGFDACDRVYVVEQNRDAQMLGLMRQELNGDQINKLRKVLHYNGLPIDARSITDDILAKEGQALVKHEFGHAHENAMGGVGGE